MSQDADMIHSLVVWIEGSAEPREIASPDVALTASNHPVSVSVSFRHRTTVNSEMSGM